MNPLNNLLQTLLVLLPMGLLSWWLSQRVTAWSIHHAHRKNILAEVNERSSHSIPTPRVGGMGMIVGYLPGFLLAFLLLLFPTLGVGMLREPSGEAPLSLLVYTGFLIPIFLAFGLGLLDDHRDPPALLKLGLQVLIAALPPVLGLRLEVLHFPPLTEPVLLHPLAGGALTFLWVLLVMNAVNFMDGINGIAGRFGQWVGVFTFLGVANLVGTAVALPLAVGLAASSLGFLKYNIPKAETFMGDSGSQPLGVYVALLGVLISQLPTTFPLNLTGYTIIISLFLFDVVYTLIRRSLRGENVMKAHREHLYQRYLIASGEDHLGTLNYAENMMMALGVLGVFYLRSATPYGKTGVQLLLLAGAVGLLAYYLYGVLQKERTARIS